MVRVLLAVSFLLSVIVSLGQDIMELSEVSKKDLFLDSARQKHKNALFFITTKSCVPCNDMENSVLSEDSVKQIIDKNVYLSQINVSSSLGEQLTKNFKIKKIPSAIFYDKKGEFLTILRGDVPHKRFLNVLNSAVIYEQVMEKLDDDSLSRLDLFFCIETLSYLNRDSAGRAFAQKYLRKLSFEHLLDQDNELVLRKYLTDLEDEKTLYLIKNDEQVTSTFGKGFYDEMVRNLFEYNLNVAVEQRDTNRVHLLENNLLDFYLGDKAITQGLSGLWQRYYIGTELWYENREEVLSLYKFLQDESYLLDRAAMVLQKYYMIPQMVDNALEWLKIAEYVEKNFDNQIMLGQLYLIKKDYKNAKKKVKKAKKYANVRSKINRVDDLEYGIEIQTEKK